MYPGIAASLENGDVFHVSSRPRRSHVVGHRVDISHLIRSVPCQASRAILVKRRWLLSFLAVILVFTFTLDGRRALLPMRDSQTLEGVLQKRGPMPSALLMRCVVLLQAIRGRARWQRS